MKDATFIKELLGDEFAQAVISELGMQDETPEEQAEFISELGLNVMLRVNLEIAKLLPEEERPQFESFIGSGDIDGLRKFLAPHIPDLDRFVYEVSQTEYEGVKKRIREIAQRV